MDRRLFLKLLSASGSLVLAGCAGGGGESEAPVEPEGDSEPAGTDEVAEPTAVRVAALKGPTAMGMVKLMCDAMAGPVEGNEYSFEILAAPDELTPKVFKGEVDIACVPANLAAVLYSKTEGGVRACAINTLGVLYICEKGDTIHEVADLAGRTIYASGKGATPEYALQYVLDGVGLADSVPVEWKSEHAECVAALANDPAGVAMLPQPFVTVAQTQDEGIRVAPDLNEEWATVAKSSGSDAALVTGATIVRAEFAFGHPEAFAGFMGQYAASVDWVNANTDEAAALIGGYDIIAEPVAKKALPHCNIVCITGDELRTMLDGYLNVLYDANPEAVGGSVPGEGFYTLP